MSEGFKIFLAVLSTAAENQDKAVKNGMSCRITLRNAVRSTIDGTLLSVAIGLRVTSHLFGNLAVNTMKQSNWAHEAYEQVPFFEALVKGSVADIADAYGDMVIKTVQSESERWKEAEKRAAEETH